MSVLARLAALYGLAMLAVVVLAVILLLSEGSARRSPPRGQSGHTCDRWCGELSAPPNLTCPETGYRPSSWCDRCYDGKPEECRWLDA